MNGPLVSCIVPVFDGERYLEEALQSVFAQTHRSIEVIVVDDGSTDRSREVASSHASVVCISQPNAGHAAARNRGLAAASGEFVAFLDADDLWHEDKLTRQLHRFAARPELGVVFTYIQNFRSPELPASPPQDRVALPPVPGYTSVSMLARRHLFERVGALDVTLKHGNDRDWFCRAAEQGVPMEMMPDVLVRRRLHDRNRSAASPDDSRREYLRILKASLDRRRSYGTAALPAYPFRSSRRDGD